MAVSTFQNRISAEALPDKEKERITKVIEAALRPFRSTVRMIDVKTLDSRYVFSVVYTFKGKDDPSMIDSDAILAISNASLFLSKKNIHVLFQAQSTSIFLLEAYVDIK